jgi:hypothetical protein
MPCPYSRRISRALKGVPVQRQAALRRLEDRPHRPGLLRRGTSGLVARKASIPSPISANVSRVGATLRIALGRHDVDEVSLSITPTLSEFAP